MATLLLMALGGLAAVLRWRKHPRAARVAAWCAGVWLLLVGSGVLPAAVLERLQPYPRLLEPSWRDRNVIVVLGSGNARWPHSERMGVSLFGIARVTEAARLFQHCRARGVECRVVTTGGDPTRSGTSESALMTELLVQLGVPAERVTREEASNNTFQNAQHSAALVGAGEQVVLVSSAVHLTRAVRYFAHFGVDAVPAPSDVVSASSPWHPALNFTVMDLAAHELAGIVRLHVYNALGLNGPAR